MIITGPGAAPAIIGALERLGLVHDGTAEWQSARTAHYARALERLRLAGLAFPCGCSRSELAAAAPGVDGPVYPGTCRRLPADARATRMASGARFALRLDMTRALGAVPGPLTFEEETVGVVTCNPAAFGDAVLARKDAPASYHLCVTHDDAIQGVTLVTRGEDLKPATHLHRLIQALMGWPAPRHAHHRLLTGADGRRLAKRDRAATLRDLRSAGATPAEVRALAVPPA